MALPPESSKTPQQQRQSAEQDVFLREVDDALRQDQALDMARRYGLPVGIAIVLGLAALAGWLGWNWYTAKQAGERAERYILALDQLGSGSPDAAAKDMVPLTTEGSSASRAVAALTRAAIQLGEGKKAEAIKGFAAIAADPQVPAPYRNLALVREVSTNFDAMAPQDVVARLKPLAVPGNPWFGSAGELVAMAYLKQNQPQLAGALFGAMAKDDGVPDSLRARARQFAAQLGVDTSDDALKEAGAVHADGAPQ